MYSVITHALGYSFRFGDWQV